MANHVSADQARELADAYRVLLDDISDACDSAKNLRRKAVLVFRDLLTSGTLSDAVSRDLAAGFPTVQSEAEFGVLRTSLNKAIAVQNARTQLNKLYDTISTNQEEEIDLLEKAPSGLSRFLAGEARLHSIDRVYAMLDSHFDSWAATADSLIASISEVADSRDDDDRWLAPINGEDGTEKASFLLKSVSCGEMPSDIKEVLDALRWMSATRKRAAELADQKTADVVKAVELYRTERMMIELVRHQVDELSQMKRRVRVKALKDAGFLTIAVRPRASRGCV